MKRAILNVADTGPLESLVIMLRSIGYDCYLPNAALRSALRRAGCDTVLEIEDLVCSMGYERPMTLPEAGPTDAETCDLIVDVKAHRNYPRIVSAFPSLAGKVLWYRINGGPPEHVIKRDGFDCGDEADPPCPILTPNLWYQCQHWNDLPLDKQPMTDDEAMYLGNPATSWAGRAYSCYPPFYRFDEYYPTRGRQPSSEPICLIHNLSGWGYGALADNMRKLGVKCYGEGSPDGLIPHQHVPQMLSTALCMVHLKSSDAPGYALYEALAAACPVVCTRRLIWRNRMQDLLIPDHNCLVFDRETHDGLSPQDVTECTEEVRNHLQSLQDQTYNGCIGRNGRTSLEKVMWSENKKEDVASLKDFMERNFR